jgi:hypothetical protein
MASKLRSRLSYANVVSTICLFVVLGGTSYGLATGSIDSREIKNNTVRSKDIRNSQVRGRDIRNSTIRSRDVALDALLGADINESTLGQVPRAATAGSASTAGTVSNGAIGSEEVGTIDMRLGDIVDVPDGQGRGSIARCGPGQKLISGGGSWIGLSFPNDNSDLQIQSSGPRLVTEDWFAAGYNPPGGVGTVSFVAIASCLAR